MRLPRFQVLLAVLLLLALHFGLAMSAAALKSATFDEHMYITGGYSYWATGESRLDPGIGMLPARWATSPLIPMHLKFPGADERCRREANVFETGNRFLYGMGNDLPALLLRARVMIALASVGLGLVVFAISKQLWGIRGAFLSLVLYSFSPAMLAHGCLVTSDLMVALFFTLATWSVWRLLHRVDLASIAAASISLCGLALAKMSAILFIPTAALLVLARLITPEPIVVRGHALKANRWRSLGVILGACGASCTLLVWLGIWAIYGFRYGMLPDSVQLPGGPRPDLRFVFEGPGFATSVIVKMMQWRVLPEAFLYNCACAVGMVQVRQAFLVGEYSIVGFPLFFPLAFLFKTPVAFLFLLLVAALAWRRKNVGRDWLSALYPLVPYLVFVSVYGVVALRSHLNIGERHLLPIYPVLFILAGAAAWFWETGGRVWKGCIAALLLWFVCSSLLVWPNYLTYFNELAGGPKNGYRYLVDSSLDWGQDLPGLRKYMDEQNVNRPERSFYAYFGTADPEYYGIKATRLDSLRPNPLPRLTGGVYCVSASCLQSVSSDFFGHWCLLWEAEYRRLRKELDSEVNAGNAAVLDAGKVRRFGNLQVARFLAFLRQREPEGEINNSILVFHLRDDEVNNAIWGQPAELLKDDGVRRE